MTHTPPWPARRGITSVQLLTQLGLDHGLPIETCLADTGLDMLQLADPQWQIDASQELQLIANLIGALPQVADLGLQAGQRYQLTTYGIWGYALLSSQTFRQAVELGLRYLDLTFAFNRIRLEEDAQHAYLYLDDRGLPDNLRDFLVQRDAMAMLVIQRELTPMQLPLLEVRLRMAAPADPERFTERLGRRPEFACADNCVRFDRRFLDQPLPRANPYTVQLCETQCQALLAKYRNRDGLAGRVRDRLLRTPGRLANMEQVAAELHLSSRTLRRRLDEQGTTFRLLQEEVREALAEEFLTTGGLTLEEIAERLGYGETSNFLHAFKRWKGQTPRQYRRKRQA
ncbi:AraC family transcriptional regulator [Pseudomonas sp. CrR25]|nr:AraC family transcriptional regulator [Pseudomonas sp. CrR25]